MLAPLSCLIPLANEMVPVKVNHAINLLGIHIAKVRNLHSNFGLAAAEKRKYIAYNKNE